MIYQLISSNRSRFSVETMARILQVSKSGFYKWLNRSPNSDCEELAILIQSLFREFKMRYGVPRITAELKARGYQINHKKVAKIMRQLGLKALAKRRKWLVTTNSKHHFPIAPNLLKQNFRVARPNQVWVSDITYIKVRNGWAYLCVIIDLYTRELIGYQLANHMRVSMVKQTLLKAIRKKKPNPGLIFHSDRGIQYASHSFRNLLKENKMTQSMSRKGNCYDNAPAESFFRTLKVEEIYRNQVQTFEQLNRSLFSYIEMFYNSIRRHSSLNMKSPMQFAKEIAA